MSLTVKQQSFINHYLANGGNGTQAAKDAKYKGKTNTLAAVAKENLRKPQIKEAIDNAINELKLQTGISAENKRNMLWDVARRCSQEISPIYVNGKKIENPQDYVPAPEQSVPPGDCIIIDFSPGTADFTNKLCESWEANDWNYDNVET